MPRRTRHLIHGVTALNASHPAMRRVRRAGAKPGLHGNKLWRSSLLLVDYLASVPPQHHEQVLDVGCGWGLAGIWCAKQLGSSVTALDADPGVFPYLAENAAANGVTLQTMARPLQRISRTDLSSIDLLVAADICFWDDMARPVFNLLTRAVDAGVRQIVIADPGRPPFIDVAQRASEHFCADILDWRTSDPLPARGAMLVLHNA